MKIIGTSDLHLELEWYDWLISQRDMVDIIVIAGDLLNALSEQPLKLQQKLALEKIQEIEKGRAVVAICSGNHDGDSYDSPGNTTCNWLKYGKFSNKTVPDGKTKLLTIGEQKVLISCIPFANFASVDVISQTFLKCGAIKQEHGCPWILLHHEPPTNSRIGKGPSNFTNWELYEELRQEGGFSKPDFVFCGHLHDAPHEPSGSWVDIRGKIYCFNPGCVRAKTPSHILIDTDKKTAKWIVEGLEKGVTHLA